MVVVKMMQNIGVDTGDFMKVSTANLPRATFVKIQPQSVNFLDISNPKAVYALSLSLSLSSFCHSISLSLSPFPLSLVCLPSPLDANYY